VAGPDHPQPAIGQVWIDRGVPATVERVSDDGGAIMRLEDGMRIPVRPSFFTRALLANQSAATPGDKP